MDMIKKLPSEVIKYEVLPDDFGLIKNKLIDYADKLKADIILTTGGTGFSPRDITPEATKEVIDREVPGIPEAMRIEGLKKTDRAMLSRAVAGIRGSTLIINLPGSKNGAKESLEAILPVLSHAVDIIKGKSVH